MTEAAGIILAAGFSRRLGRPKQNLLLQGVPLLARAVRTVFEAGLSPILVVVREPAHAHQLKSFPVQIVVNEEAAEGMASSIRAGVRALEGRVVHGAVFLTCDQPLLRADHLRALVREPARVTASAYARRVGIPAYFPVSSFPSLLLLTGDAGARGLLHDAATITDENLALDIDTEADLERAKKLLRLR